MLASTFERWSPVLCYFLVSIVGLLLKEENNIPLFYPVWNGLKKMYSWAFNTPCTWPVRQGHLLNKRSASWGTPPCSSMLYGFEDWLNSSKLTPFPPPPSISYKCIFHSTDMFIWGNKCMFWSVNLYLWNEGRTLLDSNNFFCKLKSAVKLCTCLFFLTMFFNINNAIYWYIYFFSMQVDLTVQEKEIYLNVSRWFNHIQHYPGVRQHLTNVIFIKNRLYTSAH